MIHAHIPSVIHKPGGPLIWDRCTHSITSLLQTEETTMVNEAAHVSLSWNYFDDLFIPVPYIKCRTIAVMTLVLYNINSIWRECLAAYYRGNDNHYTDVVMSECLESPASRLFVQPFVSGSNKRGFEGYPVLPYSISQEICTRFCCALLCCGYAIVHNEFTWSIYPYSSGLLCWHWDNR